MKLSALTSSFLLGAAAWLGFSTAPARADVTLTMPLADTTAGFPFYSHTRRVTMRVGATTFGTVNNVAFDVTGANVGPTPLPVVGVPNANAGINSGPTNSVRISVSNTWTDFAGQRVIVTVDSAAGLVCTSGPCGSTVIPFNNVSWTSFGLETGAYVNQDFLSGNFTGGLNQTLLDFTAPPANRFFIANNWIFSYANNTLYPAGVYQGRVTFTATMP